MGRVKTILRNPLIIVLLSVFSSLILLEGSLRLAGVLYHAIRGRGELAGRNNGIPGVNSATVICLGDSYTYGVGTSFASSYPRQLERLLNEKQIAFRVDVHNCGSPGGNSSRILKILNKQITEYTPRVAIIMVGINNSWNVEGMSNRYSGWLPFDISELRVYKLLKIFIMNLKERKTAVAAAKPGIVQSAQAETRRTIPPAEMERYVKKIEAYRGLARNDLAIRETEEMLKRYPDACALYVALSGFLRETGDTDSALEAAKKAVAYSPYNRADAASAHMELVYIYTTKKSWSLARQEMDYAVEDPQYLDDVFSRLKSVCGDESGLNFEDEIQRLRTHILSLYGKNAKTVLDTLAALQCSDDRKRQMLEADLSEAIKIAREHDIAVVLMTYPLHQPMPNEAIRSAAREHQVVLVDNELIFDKAPHREELFAEDGHCNERGYGLIASSIHDALVDKSLLNEVNKGKEKWIKPQRT